MEKNSTPTPVTPQSLVTEENVKKALLADKGNEARLISWKVVDFTHKGDNYACVVSSVEVKYNLKGQDMNVTYVVKLNPCRGMDQYEYANALLFEKEAKFYLNILPDLNSVLADIGLAQLRLPRCLHGDLEDRKQQIYLNDMRPHGFKMFDKRRGMDVSHASLVFKELGRLHAASFLLEDKTKQLIEEKHDFLTKDMLNVKQNKDMLPMVVHYVETSIAILKKVDGYERAIAWAESLIPRLEKILSEGLQSVRYNVVNHGDCWNNNIIFKYNEAGEPVEVTLLDLQICRKASLAVDLNYFLFTSFNGDVRKNNLKSFLSTYYNSFKITMEAGGLDMTFTEDDLMEEFVDKNTAGAFFSMIVVPIILLESDDFPDLTASEDRDVEQIMAEYQAKAMEMVGKNPLIKPRFLSIFDELMETGLIP